MPNAVMVYDLLTNEYSWVIKQCVRKHSITDSFTYFDVGVGVGVGVGSTHQIGQYMYIKVLCVVYFLLDVDKILAKGVNKKI